MRPPRPCARAGGARSHVRCDVTKTEALERWSRRRSRSSARIDVLVNNAGGTRPAPGARDERALLRGGAALQRDERRSCSRGSAVPQMIETAGGGAIVNISSRSSDMVQTGFVAYGAAQGRAQHADAQPRRGSSRRRCASTRSRWAASIPQALAMVLSNEVLKQQFEANTPMGRPGTPEDIAACRALSRVARRELGDGQDLPDRRRHRGARDPRTDSAPVSWA